MAVKGMRGEISGGVFLDIIFEYVNEIPAPRCVLLSDPKGLHSQKLSQLYSHFCSAQYYTQHTCFCF